MRVLAHHALSGGWGFGTLFVAAFGGVAGLARPHERAELAAALFSVSYLAFGGSAVLAGLAVPSYGLRPTATVYGAIVIALSALAAVLGRRRTDAAPEVAEPAAVPEVALPAAPPVRVHAGAVRQRHNVWRRFGVLHPMNTEQKLRRLLTDAAGTYHPEPAGGRGRRLTTALLSWRVLAGFLAAVVAIAAIGFVIANGHHGNGGNSSSSTSSSSSSGLERSAGSSGGGASAATSDAVAAPAAGAAKSAPSAAGSGAGTSAGIAVRNARVVQTGQLELAVRKGGLRAALDRLDSIAAADGGYIAGSQANEDTTGDSVPSGSSTVRVPIDRFAAVMAKARALGKVLSSSSSARDVTGQYVDLGARISALSDTRATYLTLLSRATSIGDTLAVQQQVQQVQSQLEQLQGQQKVLADSSDLATLTVSLSEAGTAAPPGKPARASGFSKALRSAGHNFNVGLQAIITVAGPIALAALVVGFLAGLALLARRLHRRYVGGSFR